MTGRSQLDLFGADKQVELFDETAEPVFYEGDPDRVRARLHRILSEARAASVTPWDPVRARLYLRIVPQMTMWLPEEEAVQLRSEFETEMKRLHSAA